LLMEGLHGLGRANVSLGLSPREQEVMFCLCQHLSDKACAVALGISEATVHVHLRSIYRKLEVYIRSSAIHRLTWEFDRR